MVDHAGLIEVLENYPVIAAVKSHRDIYYCLTCNCKVVFVLYGNINSIKDIVHRLKNAGKIVFVHIDLLDGLSAREAAVDFLVKNTQIDGIISTKPSLIRYCRSLNCLAIQRFFVLDSLALENIRKADQNDSADLIEILPGLMPKIIRKLSVELNKPLIAGGLISDKEDVITALSAGAIAISSTNHDVWSM
ncbi:MAG: glycerol-3-phosphate responsive antiterminator [Clostridiales bacterium]|jgi:glycerol uptake operon antiterminator|nr:glycerol-3-phosphate responsive antiterminator [Clostridiales bacterium]